jgi:hypothetical protein
MPESGFTVDVDQNQYVPEGGREVSASVTVTSGRRRRTGQSGPVSESPGDYHVGVEVTPAGLGQEMLAARISLVGRSASGADVLGQGLVRAIWTDDGALSTKINARIAHYTGQAELGRAVALAHQSGNEDMTKLLANVVDVVDAETGTVRLKKQVEDADEMALDTRSTKTVRARK